MASHCVVALGAACDPRHPCAPSQACVADTCGRGGKRCHWGCNPGDAAHVADSCEAVDGQVAYCNAVPADQATSANMGGSCLPGDGCDVFQQNCPNLPLDSTQPAGANNPLVPMACKPAAPGANTCTPAGQLAAGAANCSDSCSDPATSCAKGLVCVQPIDANGNPTGSTKCNRFCRNPGTATGCGSNETCTQLEGNGRQPYSVGVCSPLF